MILALEGPRWFLHGGFWVHYHDFYEAWTCGPYLG